MKIYKYTFSLLSVCMIGLFILINPTTYAQDYEIDAVDFESYYVIDSILDLPSRNMTINGNVYEAKTVIHFPDGMAYQRSKVILNQLGRYEVVYLVTLDNRLYAKHYSFVVVNQTYSMADTRSSGYFGPDQSIHQTNLNGLHISLSRGDVFRYNDILDLSKLSKDQPFIQMSVLPSGGFGTKDVKKLFIELIDIHDPSNVLRIVGNAVDDDGGIDTWWSSYLYMQAGVQGQPTAGIEWVREQLHVNNDWGFPAVFSMYGMQSGQNVIGRESLSLTLDLDEKQLFGPAGRAGNYIIDLDDTRYVDIPWEGFKTGEVYINISADGYSRQTFDFVITRLGNKDLSPEYVFDVQGPSIFIDSVYEASGQYPNAVVGFSYPVFNASTFDAYTRQSDLSVRVFFNYFAAQRSELPIVNGRFNTKRIGTYTIEYSSKDAYGNTSVHLLHISAKTAANPIESTIVGNYDTEGFVGHRINIPSIVTSGGEGQLNTRVFAVFNGEELPIEGTYFRPQAAGTYMITFETTDIVGQVQTDAYSVDILSSDDPVYLSDPWLPEYFIADKTYTLEDLKAFDYVGGVEVDSEIIITDGNGTNIVDNSFNFIFVPDSNGFATITYRATSASGQSELNFVIPVIRVYQNGLDMRKYFDTTNLNVNATQNNITLTTVDNSDGKFTFINPLSSEIFTMRFRIDPFSLNFQAFNIVLRDIKTNEQIHVTYRKNPNNQNIQILINGELLSYEPIVRFNQGGELRLQYNNSSRTITFDGVQTRTITTNNLGQPFKGFESRRIYLEGHIQQVTGKAGIIMTQVNGQLLSNDTEDFVRPQIYLYGEYASGYQINDVVEIYRADALDVLDPHVIASLTVRNPDGSIATSVDGIALNAVSINRNYQLALKAYGSYIVTYTARDTFGSGTISFTFSLSVEDNERPVITLVGQNVSSAVINRAFSIVAANATDNVSTNLTVSVFVITPKSIFVPVTSTMTYTPTEAGRHIIRYFTMDESGNTTFIDHIVEVN